MSPYEIGVGETETIKVDSAAQEGCRQPRALLLFQLKRTEKPCAMNTAQKNANLTGYTEEVKSYSTGHGDMLRTRKCARAELP